MTNNFCNYEQTTVSQISPTTLLSTILYRWVHITRGVVATHGDVPLNVHAYGGHVLWHMMGKNRMNRKIVKLFDLCFLLK